MRPGFCPVSNRTPKSVCLRQLREQMEIVFCISAGSIEKTKIRADLGISYDMDLLRQIDMIRSMDLDVNSVVITSTPASPPPIRLCSDCRLWGFATISTGPLPDIRQRGLYCQ